MFEKIYTFSPLFKRFEKIEEAYEVMLPQDEKITDKLEMTDMGLANQSYYLRMWGGYPVYQNTDVAFFYEGEKLIEDMKQHLQKAQKFIFMECHICEDSVIWKGLLEVIRERAQQGVEVRILYDGTGSKARRHEKFIEHMKKKGIQCRVFHSRKGFPKLNYCDYRKTLVIDGRYAYTGDYEFTNDHFNLENSQWKLAGVGIKGDAVRSFSVSFLKMWNATEDTQEDPIPYLLKTAYRAAESGFVQPIATNPMKEEKLGLNAYLNMVRNAKEYIYLILPGGLKNEELKKELLIAGKRGVRVYLILPESKSEKMQKPLWEVSGRIRFFHYASERLKSSLIVCDDQVAIVGNLHTNISAIHKMFENGCWFCNCRTVLVIKNEFEQLLPFCRERM